MARAKKGTLAATPYEFAIMKVSCDVETARKKTRIDRLTVSG